MKRTRNDNSHEYNTRYQKHTKLHNIFQIINSIPDIWINIFEFLPTICKGRFQTVCWNWNIMLRYQSKYVDFTDKSIRYTHYPMNYNIFPYIKTVIIDYPKHGESKFWNIITFDKYPKLKYLKIVFNHSMIQCPYDLLNWINLKQEKIKTLHFLNKSGQCNRCIELYNKLDLDEIIIECSCFNINFYKALLKSKIKKITIIDGSYINPEELYWDILEYAILIQSEQHLTFPIDALEFTDPKCLNDLLEKKHENFTIEFRKFQN